MIDVHQVGTASHVKVVSRNRLENSARRVAVLPQRFVLPLGEKGTTYVTSRDNIFDVSYLFLASMWSVEPDNLYGPSLGDSHGGVTISHVEDCEE